MLNRSGESRRPGFVPDLRQNPLTFAVGFFIHTLSQIEEVSLYSSFLFGFS